MFFFLDFIDLLRRECNAGSETLLAYCGSGFFSTMGYEYNNFLLKKRKQFAHSIFRAKMGLTGTDKSWLRKRPALLTST